MDVEATVGTEPGSESASGHASTAQSPDDAGTTLRAALAQLSEGVIVADASGRVTFVNDAAARLHGVVRLDIMPDTYAEAYGLYTEDGRPFPSRELPLARAVRGETVRDAHWRVRRPDGSEVAVVGSARPVVDARGARIGAVLTLRDDEARLAARAAERERDLLATRLRAAFEQSPVSTVVYDATGRPLAANPAFERLWGAGLADVPADYSVLSDPQLRAAGVMPDIERAFAGEAVTIAPLRYEMAGAVGRGQVLWTQAHLYPVRDASGAVEQVVLTHADVTASHDAEQVLAGAALRAERQQALSAALAVASTLDEVAAAAVTHAAAVFGAVGVIIARVCADGTSIEIMRAGALAEDIAHEWRRFPLDAPVPLAEVARTGQPIFLESRSEWAGRYSHLAPLLEATGHHANAVVPLVADGHVLGALGAAFDAPRSFGDAERALVLAVGQQCAQALERARLFEAERAARAEAEAANRAKGEFLAVMSHELRTPLNAIGGYAELIEMGIRGPVTEQQREDLARIQKSQRHLLGLINGVLNYARVEGGHLHYDVADVPVDEVLATAEALIAPQVRARGLTMRFSGCDSTLRARADQEKVQQIVLNLLSNAVKFTEPGGSIALSCDATPTNVAVRVADTGHGIALDQIERVFHPFIQLDARLTRTQEGTGLGLAISRDLARGMRGDLTVSSEPGTGSVFTLTLERA